jgi:hypothetical protein
MTNKELELIKTRVQQASPGPWPVRRIPNLYNSAVGDRQTHPAVRGLRVARRLYEQAPEQIERDFEFIGRAREDMPKLIEEVECLRRKLRECRSVLVDLAHSNDGISTKALVVISMIVEDEERRWEDGRSPSPGAQRARWREALETAEAY